MFNPINIAALISAPRVDEDKVEREGWGLRLAIGEGDMVRNCG